MDNGLNAVYTVEVIVSTFLKGSLLDFTLFQIL